MERNDATVFKSHLEAKVCNHAESKWIPKYHKQFNCCCSIGSLFYLPTVDWHLLSSCLSY
jgi:hypothetical protein